ncbi:uncharacterized protein LOC110840297 isoform X3 [Zootermopsis nevadensis]|uniref:uncharacterized protein LOC110840297 isoform X3 n=1 Tax=Zootermopsis nevadensis TaxID=136037 RepID=UPI000B8E7D89|nr:uncharacterized protein LOC110840297 isoform X3 [Zootermopsis nevadensis]
MSSIGGASSDAADKHETTGETGKMIRLNQPDATWGEQLLKAAADLAGTDHDGSDSELSDTDNFLTKGAFLLTPSHELSMEKASSICEKMNFKGQFSLTKTATGILFKFSHPEDYQAVFKKGFHKVTNARFYKKVPIPCRPQKTFTVFALEIPEDIPEEDIRHSMYKFNSVVEVIRLPKDTGIGGPSGTGSTTIEKSNSANPAADKTSGGLPVIVPPPPLVRVTLASLEEYNILLQNGLDFYGATFFPTEAAVSTSAVRTSGRKSVLGNRVFDVVTTSGQRVRDMLPVFDAAGFSKIPPPAIKTIKPRRAN